MAVIYDIMDYIALGEAIQATGTFDSVAAAIESGVVSIAGDQAVGGFAVIQGGAAAPVTSLAETALELAQSAELGATSARVETAAVTVLKTSSGARLCGMLSMSLPSAAAAAAPLAGFAIGGGLYSLSPGVWTEISRVLLPFCYEENKVQAFLDYVTDVATGKKKPVVLLATALIDALRGLLDDGTIKLKEEVKKTDSLGRTVTGAEPSPPPNYHVYEQTGDLVAYGSISGPNEAAYIVGTGRIVYESNFLPHAYTTLSPGSWLGAHFCTEYSIPINDYPPDVVSRIVDDPVIPEEHIPPTAGVTAPSVPVEPVVWPDVPIIVVPDPLGPDYQPIPVTPVVPLLPSPAEVPLLPAPAEDPTPDTKPDNWPEEDPWPTVVPFPFQPTEPEPDWPTIIPWPLPSEPPEEWPTHPDEWPDIDPWPEIPEQWPEDIPWPESPPNPETWPDEIPWPEGPDEWPDEVPWPTPWPEEWPLSPEHWPDIVPWPGSPDEWPETEPWPESPPDPETWPESEPWPEGPEEWPETVPWPEPPPWPVPWPKEIPYPIPFPYPDESPDPYPDPLDPPEPEKRIDPIIDPWPYPWPDPYPDPKPEPKPDPYDDPSRPEPLPDPEPEPRPEPQPDPYPFPPNPYPTPPSGDIEPSPPPIIPLPFSGTTGLISVYHPTQSELLAFANWLWVTWQDATIEKIWNNPFDGIITLFELYCTPTDVGRKNIRSGFLDSEISSETISRYTSINCGSIGVPEYFGNYLDYSPYSKCHIYLPFIGIVELNVDDIVGHGVNVTYRIDEYNGSCIAMVTVARSTVVNDVSVDYTTVMYQFSGNCSVELPIAGGSQAAIKAGMIQAAAYGISSVVSGILNGAAAGTAAQALADVGSGIAQGAANAIGSLVSAKSSVQHSGSFGSSFGALGNKKPYIIVTRPKQIQVPNYNLHYGYQAHKMVRIGECTGYIRCREVHVISPTASDEEKTLIEQLLKTGVYVTE